MTHSSDVRYHMPFCQTAIPSCWGPYTNAATPTMASRMTPMTVPPLMLRLRSIVAASSPSIGMGR